MDIWDSRHAFRNAIKRAIYEENLGLDTMAEVEDAVVQRMKLWVKEADTDARLEGPWAIQSKLTNPVKLVQRGVMIVDKMAG